jgi:ankyrin repeat protein
MEQLIEARGDVDLQMKNGFTPLHMAAKNGHVSVTKQLLEANCNVDLEAKDGLTALQLAQRSGHTAIATLIRKTEVYCPLLLKRVVIRGLVAKPELNGLTGTALSFDNTRDRYSVELDGTYPFYDQTNQSRRDHTGV